MPTELLAQPAAPPLSSKPSPSIWWKKWIAFGTGVGIEIGADKLQVTIVRVRPTGIAVVGSATVTEVYERPAAEWGSELASFLRKLGCHHIAATVLLPRADVTVRQLHLPGVSDKDLSPAVQLQLDSLHTYAEDDVLFSWARIGKTSHVLVGITRRETVGRYTSLFAEAGINIASFTFSAAAIYSAVRILSEPPKEGFVTIPGQASESLEVYGESEAKPVFSAAFQLAPQRALAVAISELRLSPDAAPAAIDRLLPRPAVFPADHDPSGAEFGQHALPYATALTSACPWLSLNSNLLPLEERRSSSRLRYVPTAVLASILALLIGALGAQSRYEDGRYVETLQQEIRSLEPQARAVEAADRAITARRARTQLLDDTRGRSKADMDALNELTRLLAPPAFLSAMDLTRTTIQLSGEAEQAATLLKVVDESPLFGGSEFGLPIARVASGEVFSIRAQREGSLR